MNAPARTPTLLVAAALALLTLPAIAQIPAAPPATAPADDALYEDPTATSSANVTQIYPNSNKENTIYTNVRRIRVKGDILIIDWAGTAVTLLPRQFVGAITINRRAATPPGAATLPAEHAHITPEPSSDLNARGTPER